VLTAKKTNQKKRILILSLKKKIVSSKLKEIFFHFLSKFK